MRIVYPFFTFLLLVPVFLSFFYILAYSRVTRDLEIFASKDLLPKIINRSVLKLRSKRSQLRVLSLIFLVVALSGPQWGYQWQETKTRGLEIIFALDASKSMLASDIRPSRFERSKLAIKDFLGKIGGNKVGLIAFAGTSFLQCPLTMDYGAFNLAMDGLTIQSIPRGGTVIGEAINAARKAFKSAAGSKILVLITDGENHEGDPVNDAKKAAKEGINIYTIGIGNPDGAPIEIRDQNGNSTFLKDSSGKQVKTALNETILKDIAGAGSGSYFKGDGMTLGLDELYRTKLLKHNQAELSNKRQKRYIDRFQIPLLLAFIFLFTELLLGFPLKQYRFFRISREQ